MTFRMTSILIALATLLGVVGAGVFATGFTTGGTEYDVPRYVIAGGGGASSGGDYEMHGTIGQSEAGVMQGGNPGAEYTLVGGFWSGGSAEPQPSCAPADLNCDGVVDVSDLLLLLGAWGPCPEGNQCPGDINNDGVVDVSDLLLLLGAWGDV